MLVEYGRRNVIGVVLGTTEVTPDRPTKPIRVGTQRPVYVTMKNNDLLWCFGTKSRAVNCSVAVVLGVATRS